MTAEELLILLHEAGLHEVVVLLVRFLEEMDSSDLAALRELSGLPPEHNSELEREAAE